MKIDTETIYELIEKAKKQSMYSEERLSPKYYFNSGVKTMAASIDAAIRLLEMKGEEKDDNDQKGR